MNGLVSQKGPNWNKRCDEGIALALHFHFIHPCARVPIPKVLGVPIGFRGSINRPSRQTPILGLHCRLHFVSLGVLGYLPTAGSLLTGSSALLWAELSISLCYTSWLGAIRGSTLIVIHHQRYAPRGSTLTRAGQSSEGPRFQSGSVDIKTMRYLGRRKSGSVSKLEESEKRVIKQNRVRTRVDGIIPCDHRRISEDNVIDILRVVRNTNLQVYGKRACLPHSTRENIETARTNAVCWAALFAFTSPVAGSSHQFGCPSE